MWGAGAIGQATRALAAVGFLAGLSACASSTAVDTSPASANIRSKPVAERSSPDQHLARGMQARAAERQRPAKATVPEQVVKPKTAKRIGAVPSAPQKRKARPEEAQDRSAATPSVAGLKEASKHRLSVSKSKRSAARSFMGSPAAARMATMRNSRSAVRYRSRSAFPTAPTSVSRPTGPGAPPAGNAARFRTVPIFWATNRKAEASTNTEARSEYEPVSFGSDRADVLRKGLALVTIPNVTREVGAIPRPIDFTVFGFEIYREAEDPEKHFTIRSLVRLDNAAFLKFAKANLDAARDFKGHCLVYVHGYRNTFNDAIYRAAQIAVDMGFDGNAFVYSWPSQGSLAGYIADRDAVDASQPHFQTFLRFLNDEATCTQVHVLAHSMGTRLVVDAFFPPAGPAALHDLKTIGQIVLASPDIDASILRSRADAIKRSPRTITLYANGNDDALRWSKTAAGGFVRAGDVVDGKPLVIEGVDTIDLTPMSEATWVFIGANHNEYAERAHILQDIALLMQHGIRPPGKRFPVYALQRLNGGTFWRYVTN